MRTICAFIFLIITLAKTSGIRLMDRASFTCDYQEISQPDADDMNRDFIVDSSCQVGKVKWYYSYSYVNLHFDKSCPFTVCFSSNALSMWRKYSVIDSTNGASVDMGSPSRDNDVCISSPGGKLDVTIVPQYMFYVLDVDFNVS